MQNNTLISSKEHDCSINNDYIRAVKTRLNIKTRISGSNEPFLEVFARETSKLNNNALANFPSFEHIRDSSRRFRNQIGSYILAHSSMIPLEL
ncbi:hypothetical protein HZS_2712 [Henneguya salminicola]|nr:hypothetical protein HZS_2712 [Henneguya salminicola]